MSVQYIILHANCLSSKCRTSLEPDFYSWNKIVCWKRVQTVSNSYQSALQVMPLITHIQVATHLKQQKKIVTLFWKLAQYSHFRWGLYILHPATHFSEITFFCSSKNCLTFLHLHAWVNIRWLWQHSISTADVWRVMSNNVLAVLIEVGFDILSKCIQHSVVTVFWKKEPLHPFYLINLFVALAIPSTFCPAFINLAETPIANAPWSPKGALAGPQPPAAVLARDKVMYWFCGIVEDLVGVRSTCPCGGIASYARLLWSTWFSSIPWRDSRTRTHRY